MAEQNFSPPNAEQLREHLRLNPPTGPSPLAAWTPMLLMSVAMLIVILAPDGAIQLLVLPLMISVFVYLGIRVRMVRGLSAKVNAVQELAMMRYWPQSLRIGWQLLPEAKVSPEMHGRIVVAIAHSLDQVGAYDAAIIAYSYLIERMSPDHPGSLQLRLQRTLTQLANDQLADADDALRRMRSQSEFGEGGGPTTARAAFRLANLFQQVRTHHWDDAVETSDGMLDDLRPLGIDAGYGHALLALSFHQMKTDDEAATEKLRRQAKLWWSRATMLLPVSTLGDRLIELKPMIEDPSMADAVSPSQPPQEV